MKTPLYHLSIQKTALALLLFLSAVRPALAQNTRIWATYYGGPSYDLAWSVATDAAGNVYIAGFTGSTTAISSGGFQMVFGGGSHDAFLAKFNSAGVRQWATYFGGGGYDIGFSVTADAFGSVYLAGRTNSAGLGSGGFQNTISGGADAFLIKYDATTGARIWSTYYGDTGDEIAYCVTTDIIGNVYLSGSTTSMNNIASGGFQNVYGGGPTDAFLVKFDAAGNRIWSTYYGGSGDDYGYGISTLGANTVYLAGSTASGAGIGSGGFQNSFAGGLADGYLVKFDAAGNRIWGTYYGGASYDFGHSCAVDGTGDVYLAGHTNTTVGLSSGGFQNTFAGGVTDAYLVKFDAAGNRIWATYYGGTSDEEVGCVTTDASNNVYLGGDSYSTIGLASGGYQNSLVGGQENQFAAKFDAAGNRMCATYYGQAHDEECHLAIDNAGNLYLAGQTGGATGIASPLAHQTALSGVFDSYLVKFTTCSNPLTCTASATTILCNGQCNGTGTANPTGGVGPYTYSWNSSPVQTTQTATGLCAGNYTVTVTDASSATTTSTIVITQPTALTASIANTNVNCNGGNNATATVTASGGTSGYSYSWNNSQTGITATGLSAGTYSVYVTDANGCTSMQTIVITQPAPLIASASATNTGCATPTGTATATVSGGTGPYTYSWNNSQTNLTATGLNAATYTVYITDANGCTQTATATVSNLNGPTANANVVTNVLCNGGANGSAIASATGGTLPYTYLWSNAQTNAAATNLSAGTYTVIVTDANGCTSQQTITITEPTVLSLSSSSTPDTCMSTNGTANVLASGGTGPYSYSWSNGATTQNITALSSGTYTVVITDSNGCSQTQNVTVASTGNITANAGTNVTITQGNSTTLSASGGTSYSWTPAAGLSCTTCAGPIATPSITTTYIVYVTNSSGCSGIDSVTVTVIIDAPCNGKLILATLLPNAFSPNHDGKNDQLCIPSGTCITDFAFTIFDRWGEKVFESDNILNCWDGTFKGQELNTGVFVYFFEATLSTGESIKQQGNISLIK